MCCGKICSTAHVKRAEGIHAEVAQDMLETANKDPNFPKKFVPGDESWAYDPETKAHFPMEVAQIFTSEEGTAKSEQCQDHVNGIF